MKRSVNFNGFTPAHRRISPADLIVTLRALGYTDAQIKAQLQQMQANANANANSDQPDASQDGAA